MNNPVPMRSGSVRSRLTIGQKFSAGAHDEHAAHELHQYIHNDGDLHRQQHHPIIKNLMHKKARGIYDSTKAHKLFGYLADNGAQKYHKENGSPGTPWHHAFTTSTRHEVARRLRDDFEGEAKLGNYDHLVPKKYAGKPIKHSDDAELVAMLTAGGGEGAAFAVKLPKRDMAAGHHEALTKHGFTYEGSSGKDLHHYSHPDGRTAQHHAGKGLTVVNRYEKGQNRLGGGVERTTHGDAKDLEAALVASAAKGAKHSSIDAAVDEAVERFSDKGPSSGHFHSLTFRQHTQEQDYHHEKIHEHTDRARHGDATQHSYSAAHHASMKEAHHNGALAETHKKMAAEYSAKGQKADADYHSGKEILHRKMADAHVAAAASVMKGAHSSTKSGKRVYHPAFGDKE